MIHPIEKTRRVIPIVCHRVDSRHPITRKTLQPWMDDIDKTKCQCQIGDSVSNGKYHRYMHEGQHVCPKEAVLSNAIGDVTSHK